MPNRCWRMPFAALLLLVSAGCTDLTAVRDFARTSSAVAESRPVIDSYAGHPSRMRQFFPPERALELQEQTRRREAQKEGLNALQHSLSLYMSSLGSLAADETVSFSTNPLVTQVNKVGIISAESVTAVSAAGDLLLRAAASGWRQRETSRIIGEAHPHVLRIIETLETFVANATASDDAQALSAIDGYYGGLARRSRDPAGVAALAEWRAAREREVRDREPLRTAYIAALRKIRDGHQLLFDRRNDLSVEDTIRQIRAVESELREIGKRLDPLVSRVL